MSKVTRSQHPLIAGSALLAIGCALFVSDSVTGGWVGLVALASSLLLNGAGIGLALGERRS